MEWTYRSHWTPLFSSNYRVVEKENIAVQYFLIMFKKIASKGKSNILIRKVYNKKKALYTVMVYI